MFVQEEKVMVHYYSHNKIQVIETPRKRMFLKELWSKYGAN